MDRAAAAGHEGHHPPPLLERLVFFSDAVFAIAITLLVIEISVPHVPGGSDNAAHLYALAQRIPNFIGFFVSFAVIGAFWNGHHRAFGHVGHYAPGLVLPNLAMLCAIAFMPFATAYMAENFGSVVPTATYNIVLLTTAFLNLHLIRKVIRPPYLGEAADPREVAITRARPWGVVGGASAGLVTSFLAPQLAQIVLVTIPLWIMLAIRIGRRGQPD